jgi:hypothetical protein
MTTPRIVVYDNSVELWGLTRRQYVLAALEALDQADVSPERLAQAYRNGRGKTEQVLDELDLLGAP